MLARVLALSDEIQTTHEPHPRLTYENYLLWAGRLSPERAQTLLARHRDPLVHAARERGGLYVDTSVYLTFFTPHLHTRYQPKFIHLLRDGRDFVRSGMSRKNWYALPRPLRRAQMAMVDALPFRPRLNARREYLRLWPPEDAGTKLEKIAWLWAEYNTRIEQMLDSCGSTHLQLRLEDVQSDPRAALTRVLEYIGATDLTRLAEMVALCETRPNRTTEAGFPAADEWSAEQRAQYTQWAGTAAAHFAYG